MNDPESQRPKSDTQKDRYRMISKIESGGMADIFLGVQIGEEALDRLVVIKKIGAPKTDVAQATAMFLDEARIVASLNHPHIVKIFDLIKLKNSICITMEYVDGENLSYLCKELVKINQTVPLAIACQLVVQTCEALEYAHTATAQDGSELNIVHRDLDLRNLMIDRHGHVKIIDFGVAKASNQLEITAPTIFKGKLSYAPPESFVEPTVDHRADIYALGLVLRQLVTGQKPFSFNRDANVGLVVQTITKEELPKASSLKPGLPLEIDALIEKATAKNRNDRFQNATEFANAITDFAGRVGCGIAKPSEIREWFHREFAERVKQRKAFEQGVLEKARILAEKAAAGELEDDDSIIPGPIQPKKETRPPSIPTKKETIPKHAPLKPKDHAHAVLPEPAATAVGRKTSPSNNVPEAGQKRVFDLAAVSINAPPAPAPKSDPLSETPMLTRPVTEDTGSFHPVSTPTPPIDGKRKSQEYDVAAPTNKRVYPYLLAGFVFAMIIAGAFIFQKFFRETPENIPASASLQKAVTQRAVSVPVEETPLEKVPENGPKQQTESEILPTGDDDTASSSVAVEPETEQHPSPVKTAQRARKKQNRTARTTPKLEEPQSLPVEPKEKPEIEKTVPETTWLSATGNWSGAQVASRGCLTCHKGGILLMSKTEAEWKLFFLEEQHTRHEDLNRHFSKVELKRILAYILRKIEQRKQPAEK